MRLSGCIEMLLTELPDFSARIHAAKAAGLDAVEFWRWREKDIDAIAAALEETELPLTCFSVEPAGRLVDPATHRAFLRGVGETIPTARLLGADKLIVLAGDELPGVPAAAQRKAIVDALRLAAPIAADGGITLLLEPLNTRLDHVGYFLDRTLDGLSIVEEVDHPSVRLIYDIYHSCMMDELPAEILPGHGPLIAHVHAADRPGRHEPGSGTIDWKAAIAALVACGYEGAIGLEFRPTGSTLAALEGLRTRLRG